MDHGHYDAMNRGCPPELLQRIRMLMDYAPDTGTRDVPDPYYGKGDGFAHVYDMIEAASRGLLAESKQIISADALLAARHANLAANTKIYRRVERSAT